MSHRANDIWNDHLRDAMVDIAATGCNDPERYKPAKLPAGPSLWEMVKDQPDKFGPAEDFRIIPRERDFVFYAVSDAALQWAYSKLPEDIDRYQDRGFIIEKQWQAFIVHRARNDKLMSLEDYENACEEMNQQARQWE
jgi:hypothetical protein